MFQYEITDARDFNRRQDKQSAFETWALKNLPVDGLHLKYKGGNTLPFKGKTHEFLVASWGDYMGGDNKPRRFIAYRAAVVNHTIVHTWTWDVDHWLPMSTQAWTQF